MSHDGKMPEQGDEIDADVLQSLLVDSKWIELFKDKQPWVELFGAGDPQGEWRLLLTRRKPQLGERLAERPEIAELLMRHPGWRAVFSDRDEAAEFLTSPLYLDRLKALLAYPAWIGLFKDKTKPLLEKLDPDGAWEKAFKMNPKWLMLLISKPEWVELFLHKPEWFERLADDFVWAQTLAADRDWAEQFARDPEWALVFAYELKKIEERRIRDFETKKSRQDKEQDRHGQTPQPVFNKGSLIGLAFSGGGIRSATFGLGVLEGLRDFGLLKKVDYLSTVSGGGYVGAWLSGNCRRAADNGVVDWLSEDAKDKWTDSIRHLRRYSNYLSPKVGFFSADTWTMAAVWLRNTLMIQLTVVLSLVVVLLLPHLLFPLFVWWPDSGVAPLVMLDWRWLTVALFILGVTGIAYNNRSLNIKNMRSSVQAAKVVVLMLLAWLLYQSYGFDPFIYRSAPSSAGEFAVAIGIAACLMLAGFFLLPAVLKFRQDTYTSEVPVDYSQGTVQRWVVWPMLAVGFFVAAIVWQRTLEAPCNRWTFYGDFFSEAWAYWPFPLTVAYVSLFLLAYCCLKNGAASALDPQDAGLLLKLEKGVVAVLAAVGGMAVLYLLITVIMWLFHEWKAHADEHRWLLPDSIATDEVGKWLAYVWGPSMILFAFSIAIIIMLGLLGRHAIEGVREWWSRLGAWLSIYAFGWLVVSVIAVYSPTLLELGLGGSIGHGVLGGTWLGTTIAGVFAGKSTATVGKAGASGNMKIELIAKLAPFVFILGLLVSVSLLVSALLAIDMSPALQPFDWLIVLLALGGALTLLLGWRVDINEFSFNAFYRNRLARCYLGATRLGATRATQRDPQIFTGFDDGDDLPLADLADSSGPLHIVNCALNLGGSCDLALHTRQSAIFTLTPYAFGSRYRIKADGGADGGKPIGYVNTREFCKRFGQPTLGQAVAVSGAAANPNMGYHTSPVTAFLMTLFNVRLGWWFPNPSKPEVKHPSPWFGLTYLLMELFGAANEGSDYLSISDGGHFENLAGYELIKRQCKVVIVSDGECDPSYRFEGLGTLIRMCEVDFGAKIEIDVRAVRPEAGSPWSRSRCAVGEITYRDGTKGTLIYLKASMNGHEDTAVMQYKSSHDAFPHESTADQFYGEDQFESYRCLGREITERTFNPVLKKINPKTRLYDKGLFLKPNEQEPDWIQRIEMLRDVWAPLQPNSSQFSRHADRLMALWSEISSKETLHALDEQLAGTWPQQPSEQFRPTYYFCSEMIQLMENVYLDLDFEETWKHPDNEGWRTLFIRWAMSPAFQETWKMTHLSYGSRFRYFCHRHLRLPLDD